MYLMYVMYKQSPGNQERLVLANSSFQIAPMPRGQGPRAPRGEGPCHLVKRETIPLQFVTILLCTFLVFHYMILMSQ